MRTWAFVSQKGGSGKSTLSTQLAVYAEECGEAVVIFDLDPQASAVTWSTVRGTRQPAVIAGTPEKVAELVEQAPNFGATLAIIDTAPHTDAGALSAIRAANLIVCPTQPSLFDVAALGDTMRLLDLCGARDKAVCIINGLPHQGSNDAYQEAAAVVARMGFRTLRARVGHRRPFVIATGQGKGVTETHKKDAAAKEVRDLWKELNGANPLKIAKAPKEKVA